MSALDHLTKSDTLQIPGISYHYFDARTDIHTSVDPACIKKTSDALEFRLTSQDLSLSVPGLTLLFEGSAVGNVVTWNLDTTFTNLWSGLVQIQRAHGQIVTTVDSITPIVELGCDNIMRDFEATLSTVGANNTVTIETSAGTATVAEITIVGALAGRRRIAPTFALEIVADHWETAGCGTQFQLTDSTANFTATITNPQPGFVFDSSTFLWHAPPHADISSDVTQTIRWNFGPEAAMKLSVTVSHGGPLGQAFKTANLSFAVLTQEEAAMWSVLCLLRNQLTPSRVTAAVVGVGKGITGGGKRIIDPLWDPTPDELRTGVAGRTRGFSLHEMHQIGATAQKIGKAAASVTTHIEKLIARRESELKTREQL